MVMTKATWWVTATATLALGASTGCSAGAADIEDQGVGNTAGSGANGGGYSNLGGGGMGVGGGLLLTGGTGSGALPKGVVRGRLRDFAWDFPDYRPRNDPVMGDANALVQAPGSTYTKQQSEIPPGSSANDIAIVGPVLGADRNPVYAGDPFVGTDTTWGSVHPGCVDQPCFNYWYNDVPGVNQAIDYDIQLIEDPATPGLFVFDNGGQMWFPLDGQLFGNDDSMFPEHNYGFTYELSIEFKYVPGQEFKFEGDDDVFVYIDDQLVVNLGGIHRKLPGPIALDTLGLAPDSIHMLYFFFAERNPTFSNFRIETTIAPDDWVIY